MTLRLIGLYASSRRVGWALAGIVMVAMLRWVVRTYTSSGGQSAVLLELMPVTAAATVIAAGLVSPFGAVERSAGTLLPALRTGQVLGTTLVAAAGFAITGSVRDLVGFVGIALVTARLLGARRCWIFPLGYALLCAGEVELNEYPAWAWAIQPADSLWAFVIACLLLAAGLVAAASH